MYIKNNICNVKPRKICAVYKDMHSEWIAHKPLYCTDRMNIAQLGELNQS